jgi:hypothetical protein
VQPAGSGSSKSSWCDLRVQKVFRIEQKYGFRKQIFCDEQYDEYPNQNV